MSEIREYPNKLGEHFCDALNFENSTLTNKLRIEYYNNSKFWYIRLSCQPDLIIKFCPYCGEKLKTVFDIN